MRKLIMTLGLPGSGKSYWADLQARKLAAEGLKTIIVCKDDIRKQLAETGWVWSREAERDVIRERDSRIRTAFGMDADAVIVADTNFGKHKHDLQVLAQELNVAFEVKDLTHVDLPLCIQRDAARAQPVGEQVIRQMHEKYLSYASALQPYVPNPNRTRAIICDLDGTLALFAGKRSPYDTGKCLEDTLNEPVAEIVRTMASKHQLIYVSGREEKFRAVTMQWLKQHVLPFGPLLMRSTGDYRKDFVVKLELFDTFIRDAYCVDFVLDDRDAVVQMWRKLGLTCLQVANGNF